MAKPLGPKSILIREAIKSNPSKGNTEIAEMLNDAEERKDDKIKVSAGDVVTQRQALKKAGEAVQAPREGRKGGKKGGKEPGRKAAVAGSSNHGVVAQPASLQPSPANPVDLIDKTLDLAAQAGGLPALKRLVERLHDMQRFS